MSTLHTSKKNAISLRLQFALSFSTFLRFESGTKCPESFTALSNDETTTSPLLRFLSETMQWRGTTRVVSVPFNAARTDMTGEERLVSALPKI